MVSACWGRAVDGLFRWCIVSPKGDRVHGAWFGSHLRGDQITVNVAAPGQVDTPMLMTDLAPEVLEAVTKGQGPPLGRVASPEELGGVVVFLDSRHASFHRRSHHKRKRRLPDVPTTSPRCGIWFWLDRSLKWR